MLCAQDTRCCYSSTSDSAFRLLVRLLHAPSALTSFQYNTARLLIPAQLCCDTCETADSGFFAAATTTAAATAASEAAAEAAAAVAAVATAAASVADAAEAAAVAAVSYQNVVQTCYSS